MSLVADDVQQIAHLARVGIHHQDVASYVTDLSAMLALMVQMGELNTEEVEPLSHPLEPTQRLRKDQVTEINQRDKFQQLAPQIEAGLYLVPKVID
jgi:aspartyl-tRNA(Asn)/glutamyl-tRNA(Gln) amidotransferase subunit C